MDSYLEQIRNSMHRGMNQQNNPFSPESGPLNRYAGEYGNRRGGSPKGQGWLGPLKRPDGKVSTEISIGVNLDGKDMEIPLIVPTLTKEEIDLLLSIGESGNIPESIIDKAVQHAIQQLSQGKSPFFD